MQLHSDIFRKNHGEIAEQNDLLAWVCLWWSSVQLESNIKAGWLKLWNSSTQFPSQLEAKTSQCLKSTTLVFPFCGLHFFFSRTSVMMSIPPSLVATGEPNIRVHDVLDNILCISLCWIPGSPSYDTKVSPSHLNGPWQIQFVDDITFALSCIGGKAFFICFKLNQEHSLIICRHLDTFFLFFFQLLNQLSPIVSCQRRALVMLALHSLHASTPSWCNLCNTKPIIFPASPDSNICLSNTALVRVIFNYRHGSRQNHLREEISSCINAFCVQV